MVDPSIKKASCLSLLIICSVFLCFPPICLAKNPAKNPAGYAFVSGHIKDNITRLPLERVRVILSCGPARQKTFTNASGYYEFPNVPIYKWGNFYLNKTIILTFALKYRTEMKKSKLMPNKSYVFDFYLDTRFKYPILKGRVTDSATANGISEAIITVSKKNDKDKIYTGITDSDGYYKIRIENKGVGHYTVIAKAKGYLDGEPQSLKIHPLRSYTLNFSLDDIAPPKISNLLPLDGSILTTATPIISADYTDNESGIDKTVKMLPLMLILLQQDLLTPPA
jgi:hypothetical protein